jgi:hypothetical protein
MITGTVIATLALFVLAIAPTLGWFSFGFFGWFASCPRPSSHLLLPLLSL